MKHKIQAFIDGLILYDYILFGASFVLFILFIILAIVLRERLKTALFLVLFAFATIMLGPTLGFIEMHKFLYKNEVTLKENKRLEFAPAVVVKGSLKNLSRFDFKECLVTASLYKITKNEYKNYLLKFKPIKKQSILLKDIPKGQSKEFKMIVDPFKYKKEYGISLEANCK
ncbi:MAG: DUF2393 domain-containing protein [Sulfurimonas sp.]